MSRRGKASAAAAVLALAAVGAVVVPRGATGQPVKTTAAQVAREWTYLDGDEEFYWLQGGERSQQPPRPSNRV